MPFASSIFTGTALQELSAHDSAWAKQSGYTADGTLGATGAYAIHVGTGSPAVYRHSGTPAGADYSVFADLTKLSDPAAPQMGPLGRMQSGAATFYSVLYTHNENSIRILKFVGGSATVLGSVYTRTLATNETVTAELRMAGDQISCYIDGVLRVGPVTDASITTAGAAGIWLFNMRSTGDAGALDNFSASDPVTSAFTAGATLGAVSGSGSLSSTASGFTAGATLGAVAGGGSMTSSATTGTFTSSVLTRNSGAAVGSATLTWVGFRVKSTGAPVLLKTTVSVISGQFVVNDAALTPGVTIRADWLESTGQQGWDEQIIT